MTESSRPLPAPSSSPLGRGDGSTCPDCGSETWFAHRDGDAVLPECNFLVCLECEWQGEPE